MTGVALAVLLSACSAQVEENYWDPWAEPGDVEFVRPFHFSLPLIRSIDRRPVTAAPRPLPIKDRVPGKFYGPGGFVRLDISSLPADSQTLQSMRKAILAMRALPADDPHNWTYLANIHGSPAGNNPDWNQCQHGNWWFLPWHRMYLYYLERIMRRYAEDPSFCLPYWDYSNPQARTLPVPFRDQNSPLYDSTRRLLVNNGTDQLSEMTVVDRANRSMANTVFADTGSVTTFGGLALNAPQHMSRPHGALEAAPHDLVHSFLGGNMGDANTAARDPIFALHHANIDRLWEAWLLMGGGRANPSNDAWLNQTFTFYDENKQKVTVPVRQFADLGALGYSYERMPAPPPTPAPRPASQTAVQTVGAWQTQGIPLQNQPVVLGLAIPPERARSEAKKTARRMFLQISDVKFAAAPDSMVDVYVNLPANTPLPGPKSPYCAGCFTFFDHAHHGTGLSSRLECTQQLQRLFEAPGPGPRLITVTLVRTSPGTVQQNFSAPCTFNLLTLTATK